MARAILLVAGILWLAAAVIAGGLAAVGVDVLQRILPPLEIDADAIARALTALAAAAGVVGLAHLGIAAGLGRRRPWAASTGIVVAAAAAAAFLGLSAAAVTSGVAGTLEVPAAVGGTLAALAAALAYGVAGASLVRRLRSGDGV